MRQSDARIAEIDASMDLLKNKKSIASKKAQSQFNSILQKNSDLEPVKTPSGRLAMPTLRRHRFPLRFLSSTAKESPNSKKASTELAGSLYPKLPNLKKLDLLTANYRLPL